jgi:hypothetical protein
MPFLLTIPLMVRTLRAGRRGYGYGVMADTVLPTLLQRKNAKPRVRARTWFGRGGSARRRTNECKDYGHRYEKPSSNLGR